MTTQIQAKWAELEKGIIITLLCIQIGQVRSFIVWNLRIWRNWRTDTVILKHFHCAIVRSSPCTERKEQGPRNCRKGGKGWRYFLTQVWEFHFISPRLIQSRIRIWLLVTKFPLLSAAPAPSVSGQSPAPECQSQSAEDRHRIRTPGRGILQEKEISSTLSLERHQSKPNNLELLRRFR